MATTSDVWADFEQAIIDRAIDKKTIPGLCECQRRTLWTLAV